MRIIVLYSYLVVSVELCYTVSNKTNPFTLQKTVQCNFNCTEYDRSFQKLLSRNKRWFVFPKGGNVLLTMVVTKTIIGGMPRGLQESMEVEMAFSVPPWVEGWNPGPILDIKDNAAGKVTLPKESKSTPIQPKIDTNFPNNTWNYPQWSHNYGNNRRMHGNTPTYGRLQYVNHPLVAFHRHRRPISKSSSFYKSNEKLRTYPSHYHREYRERRQIFEKFEGLGKYLGIDIKSCILRAICEVKKGLLPEGESFIQDVARLVFSIPFDYEDDYTETARTEQVDCVRKFSVTCPFSPMEFFLSNGPRAPPEWNGRDFSFK